jgi:ABC-type transport system substrate-binding protein
VNPDYDKLYEKMAIMTPSKERTDIIKKAEDIVFSDSVWSMLYYPIVYTPYYGWTKNFRPNGLILNQDKYWDVDAVQRQEMRKKL